MNKNDFRLQTDGHRYRSKGIDGLRGIVSIIIALFHFELIFPFGNKTIFGTGYLGVEFFFILSGFLIAKSFLEKTCRNEISISSVIIKKIIRLYPAYIISTFLLGFLYSIKWYNGNFFKWLFSEGHLKWDLFSEIFCIQVTGTSNFEYINGPAWYVSALLITSFISSIILKYFKRCYIKYIAIIIPVILYGVFFIYDPYMSPAGFVINFIPAPLMRSSAGIFLGIFVYYMFKRTEPFLIKQSYLTISILEIILTANFIGLLILRQASRWNYMIFIPICGLIVIMFSNKGIISKLVSLKPFQLLGKISYSFYLVQSPCSNFIKIWLEGLGQPYVTIIYLIINFLLAIIIYYLFEVKITYFISMKLKKLSETILFVKSLSSKVTEQNMQLEALRARVKLLEEINKK